jgi:hypothetical protein
MTCTADDDGIVCRGGQGATVQLITAKNDTSNDEAEGGPGPNDATPDAPSQTPGSKGLRAYVRNVGADQRASWAKSIAEERDSAHRTGRRGGRGHRQRLPVTGRRRADLPGSDAFPR